jgi:hypothetical protein
MNRNRNYLKRLDQLSASIPPCGCGVVHVDVYDLAVVDGVLTAVLVEPSQCKYADTTKRVMVHNELSVDEWNMLAAPLLSKHQPLPADPETVRLNELRKAPVVKSQNQLDREARAAAQYYQETRGLQQYMQSRYQGIWNV